MNTAGAVWLTIGIVTYFWLGVVYMVGFNRRWKGRSIRDESFAMECSPFAWVACLVVWIAVAAIESTRGGVR